MNSECVCCFHNVTEETVLIKVELKELGFLEANAVVDLLGGRTYATDGKESLSIQLAPLQTLWLTRKGA